MYQKKKKNERSILEQKKVYLIHQAGRSTRNTRIQQKTKYKYPTLLNKREGLKNTQ